MDNVSCTVIHCSYRGCYSEDRGDAIWLGSEKKVYPIVVNKSIKEITYFDLVDGIYKKFMVDEANTKLILSYIPPQVFPRVISYISNDEEVYGYFMSLSYEKRRSMLHVEVVSHDNALRDDRESGVGGSTDVLVSSDRVTSRVNDGGMLTLYEDEPWQENMNAYSSYEDLRDTHMHEENPVTPVVVRGNDVIENDGVTVGWDDGINVSLYQDFETKKEVQDIVEKAAHLNCFQFSIINSDKGLYVVKCSEARNGCKWSLRAAKLKNLNYFSIRTHKKMHTCCRSTTITSQIRRKGTPRLVASVLHDDYPGVFETPTPKIIVSLTQRKLGVHVSYSTGLRGKHQAANDVRGSPEESYRQVCLYLYMLEKVNEGTVTRVEVDENERFKYLFLSFQIHV